MYCFVAVEREDGPKVIQTACKYPYAGPSSLPHILSVTKCIVLLLWIRRRDQRSLELHVKLHMLDHLVLLIFCRLEHAANANRASTMLALLENTRIFLSLKSHRYFVVSCFINNICKIIMTISI